MVVRVFPDAATMLQRLRVMETHAHADHISAAQLLKDRLGAKVAIGEKITLVQQTFKGFFDLPIHSPPTAANLTSCLATARFSKLVACARGYCYAWAHASVHELQNRQ